MIKKVDLLASLSIRKFNKNHLFVGGLLHTEKKNKRREESLLSKIGRNILTQIKLNHVFEALSMV